MTITIRPRWSLGRGKTLVPSRWQATSTTTPASDPNLASATTSANSNTRLHRHAQPSRLTQLPAGTEVYFPVSHQGGGCC
jgi:hypothetical protein